MNISKYCVSNGKKFKLENYSTSPPDSSDEKKELKEQLSDDIKEIRKLQELFFAYDRHSILMLFQAMDAAGKDGAINHVMSGINPQGCQVFAFKKPSSEEYKHNFLWRHHKVMPEKGRIGIHNRSHYEFVLSCKINPEFVLLERLPGIKEVGDLSKDFWNQRYKQIVNFESLMAENGSVIMKFFLHVSKDEQKARLIDRIDNKEKNWKFDLADVKARNQWDLYMAAYEEAIAKTAKKSAPWYIIPADDKWFARALIARILKETLKGLDMQYPQLNEEDLEKLQQAKKEILK
jgi:PPK2 family polyphosphate:nucleotide phosphotransferase